MLKSYKSILNNDWTLICKSPKQLFYERQTPCPVSVLTSAPVWSSWPLASLGQGRNTEQTKLTKYHFLNVCKESISSRLAAQLYFSLHGWFYGLKDKSWDNSRQSSFSETRPSPCDDDECTQDYYHWQQFSQILICFLKLTRNCWQHDWCW